MSSLGFVPDVTIIVITFFLMVKYNEKIVSLILWIKLLPRFLLFILTSIPLIIFEENINWGAIGNTYTLLPWTLLPLLLFLIITGYLAKKFKAKSVIVPMYSLIMFGIFWELLFGGLRGQMFVLPMPFFVFMIFFVGLSYAYITYIPLKVLLRDN
jgi:hypothetical protein